MIWGTIAQIFDVELSDEPEVLPPPVVVAALGHLVDTDCGAVAPPDRRIAVLDARSEDEGAISRDRVALRPLRKVLGVERQHRLSVTAFF